MNFKLKSLIVGLFLLFGCASTERSCAAGCANDLGADWVIVQFGMDGKPFNCWKLRNVSVANEESSDGIYWFNDDNDLVHISGWYNMVQVNGGNYDRAAKSLGVEAHLCKNGAYEIPVKETAKETETETE